MRKHGTRTCGAKAVGRPLALAAVLLAAACAAVAQDYPGDAARYIPRDADLAALARMDRLARTTVWQRFADPQVGLWQEVLEDLDLGIEPDKDVRSAAFAVKVTYQESGAPEDILFVVALELARDVQPQEFYRGRLGPAEVRGAAVRIFAMDPDVVLAFPRPRLALVGSTKYLGSALREAVSGPAGTGGGPWARLSEEPGEIVFAGRMPGALRQALEQELASWRSRRLKRGMDAERFLEFAQVYSLALMARDADAASGSLDAARQPDALRVAVEFASDRLVRAAAGLAEALAEPLAAALPVLFGAPPRAAPVREPMYRVQAEGKTVRVSMSRQALEDLAAEVTRGSRRQVTGVQSAGHLRQLGMAVQRYVADRKSYPKAWSELFAAGYLREPDVLVNPELKVHFADADYHLVPLAREPGEKAFQTVLGYERWEGAAPPGGRLNVLFADGHVENLDFDRFQHLLDLTYRAIGR